MFQLGVELLVKRIAEVGGDSLQEASADVPAGTYVVPLFFEAFARVGGRGVGDRWVVGLRLGLFDVRRDAGLMIVFRHA